MGCKKDEKYIYEIKPVFTNGFISTPVFLQTKGLSGVRIRLYNNELDYIIDRNVVREEITNQNGIISFEVPNINTNFWFSARNDTLNELRYKTQINTIASSNSINENNVTIRQYTPVLSTTPTKLELQISLDGKPLRAKDRYIYVVVYESEKNYLLEQRAEYIDRIERSALVDSAGIARFTLLEPKEYWFRISDGYGHNNEKTVFKTNGKLEDNLDINNVMTVNLQ